MGDLRRSLRGSGRLLHSTDRGGLCGGPTVSATASSLTAVADEVIERLVQVGRHDEFLVWEKEIR